MLKKTVGCSTGRNLLRLFSPIISISLRTDGLNEFFSNNKKLPPIAQMSLTIIPLIIIFPPT